MMNRKNINPIKLINEMMTIINEDFKYAQISKKQIDNIASLSISLYMDNLYKDFISFDMDNINSEINSLIKKDGNYQYRDEVILTDLSLKSFMNNKDCGIIFLKDNNLNNFFIIKKEEKIDVNTYYNNFVSNHEVAIIDSNKLLYRAIPITITNLSFEDLKKIMAFIYSKIRSNINQLVLNISKDINNKIIFGKIVNFIERDNLNESNIYSDYATIEFLYNKELYYGFCEKRHLNKYLINKNKSNNCGSFSIVGEKNIPFVIRNVNFTHNNSRLEIQLSNNSKKVVELLINHYIKKLGYNIYNFNFRVSRRIHSEITEVYSIGKLPKDVIEYASIDLNHEIIKVKPISNISKIKDYYNNVISFKELCENFELNKKENSFITVYENLLNNSDNKKSTSDLFDDALDFIDQELSSDKFNEEINYTNYKRTLNSYIKNSSLYKDLVINDEDTFDESTACNGFNNFSIYDDNYKKDNIYKRTLNLSNRGNFDRNLHQGCYLKKINSSNINPKSDSESIEFGKYTHNDQDRDYSFINNDNNNNYNDEHISSNSNESFDFISKNKKRHRLSKRERVWKKIENINFNFFSQLKK